ncbi:MAG: DUF1295 domain-containing protein [Myxococcales bacterium]|jgi:3-oxo-5-alpha-steroid 4-dehydrogenase 1|nr:MAG: DUF1295 domain-containing protein [Myxococcales bacterium]
MTTPSTLFNVLLTGVFLAAPIVALSLLFATAPYGRHGDRRAGPTLPARLGWVAMECPSAVAFAHFFFQGRNALEFVPLLLVTLWLLHYVHRSFVYPLEMRVGENSSIPVAIVGSGFAFNMVNSYLNGTWVGSYGSYPDSWLGDPRFVLGVTLFVVGFFINRRSDAILRNLRKPGETGYKIPTGGLYGIVSCPNYLGELMIWTGWAIATWSLAGLSFAVFTAANLVPRALSNHRWYKEKFEDYPPGRKAVIPFVL